MISVVDAPGKKEEKDKVSLYVFSNIIVALRPFWADFFPKWLLSESITPKHFHFKHSQSSVLLR